MTPGDYTRGRARTDTETLVQMFPELRARAFAVQGIDDYAQLKRVQDAVAKLTEGGGDWKTLQREIAAELGSDTAATRKRAETVLRTNGFQAYAAARYRKQKARAGKEAQAEQNRVLFGRTKAEKQQQAAEKALADRKIDGHKKDD